MDQAFRYFMISLVVVVAQLLPAMSALAEEPDTNSNEPDWYQIEYILFEHLTGDRHELRYESLPHYKRPPSEQGKTYQHYFESPYFANKYALLDNHLAPLKMEARTLGDASSRLNRDSRTKVLQHAAWQQSIENESQTLPLAVELTLDQDWYLDGRITIRRERYLHFEVDLNLYQKQWFKAVDWFEWIQMPTAPALAALLTPEYSLPEQYPEQLEHQDEAEHNEASLKPGRELSYVWLPSNRFYFSASRRIKDGELHYLDHPAFGAIATISKIESPDAIRFEAN